MLSCNNKKRGIELYKEYGLRRKLFCRGYIEFVGGEGEQTIIVIPGGAYRFLSLCEKYNVANAFIKRGYRAYVLHYSVSPVRFPCQLAEVMTAVDYVKSKHGGKVGVVGFSAGGHLAGMAAVMHNKAFAYEEIADKLGKLPDDFSPRPDFAVMCYPVVSGEKQLIEMNSFVNLCGRKRFSELCERLSLEKLVDERTCPVFLWHTREDKCVPCGNSEVMLDALTMHGVAAKAVYYEKGRHGLNLGDDKHAEIKGWLAECDDFLKETVK